MFWVLFLLTAWAGALLSCARLLSAATDDAPPATGGATAHHHDELTLYEVAYLAGGPRRVADLTLLSMERRRRLLLTRTGWATVLDPVGRDPLERAALDAFGPDGQSPVESVRTAVAAHEAVRALAGRLGEAGLALPEDARAGVASGVEAVRGASALILVMAAASLVVPSGGASPTFIMCWFALPLILTLGCLAIARVESHPYSAWASPAGQRLLTALDRERGRGRGEPLVAVAVHGVRALGDPDLRAALSCGNRGTLPRQREY
ncbi:TIGR04222 domain-containing membrane protein [Streptomyces sp. NPDC059917]|uniref:TIGR04222 domain-containing membrane protein n=1 Tax=Streptomyces sp. NPDC059917 TaxID=3347002 RepID=UPI00365F15C8